MAAVGAGGGTVVRSASADTRHSSRSREAITDVCPRPPRHWPAPPESVRSERSRWISGAAFSSTSVGTEATADGKPLELRPSRPCQAPAPPDWNSVRLYGLQTLIQSASALPAL